MVLYLDNLRGFSNSYIEINDINFLVGENSSGKSTILSILSLLSDYSSVFSGEFKNKYVDFGPYVDIVNKGTKNNSFKIGLKKNTENDFDLVFDEMLMVFDELNGFPSLQELYVRQDESVVEIIFTSTEIIIRIKQSKISSDIDWAGCITEATKQIDSGATGRIFPDILIERIRRNPFSYFFVFSTLISKPISKKIFEIFESKSSFKSLISNTTLIDPIRSKPERTYQPKKIDYSPEGEHIPTILRDIFLTKEKNDSKKIIDQLENFGKASGLFDKIVIDQYRKSSDSPFSLLFKLKNKKLKIANVGYGVSQILPILVEVIREKKGHLFLIQQPEVHLHPRSQAYCGEFIFNQYVNEDKKFLIETHSDFIIDRFRMMVKLKGNKNLHKKINILFFYNNGKINEVHKITINANGDYSQDQPKGFRDFFLKEELGLLGF